MTDQNGPPSEVGPRPGHHPRTRETDNTFTSNLDIADTQQSNGHRRQDGRADHFNFDHHVVDSVDGSLWEALFNGRFRLAVRCDVCGRWLTASKSKSAHRGPRCRAKVVAE